MKITTSPSPAATTIVLEGDITHAVSEEFQSTLLAALQSAPALVLECSGLNLLTSAGLRAFLLLHREAASAGKPVLLASVPPAVRDVMEVTGFWQHFTSYPDSAAAIAALTA